MKTINILLLMALFSIAVWRSEKKSDTSSESGKMEGCKNRKVRHARSFSPDAFVTKRCSDGAKNNRFGQVK